MLLKLSLKLQNKDGKNHDTLNDKWAMKIKQKKGG